MDTETKYMAQGVHFKTDAVNYQVRQEILSFVETSKFRTTFIKFHHRANALHFNAAVFTFKCSLSSRFNNQNFVSK